VAAVAALLCGAGWCGGSGKAPDLTAAERTSQPFYVPTTAAVVGGAKVIVCAVGCLSVIGALVAHKLAPAPLEEERAWHPGKEDEAVHKRA